MTNRIFAFWLAASSAVAQTSILTHHNDNARTGQYLSEFLLTPANVRAPQFGRRYFLPVDGAVYAQPLYLSRVEIPGKGLRNVLFVATSHDSLYAFDADDEPVSGPQPLWKVSFLDAAHGITTVPADDVQCDVIPELGITGTPVIDAKSGLIYLIAATKEPGPRYVFRLHAIDVATGAERPGSPAEISPPGFVPLSHKQRTALLLENGVVYSSWSGHCDLGTYHGWVMAHDAATLKLISVFNDTPKGSGASFWNGGAGPAGDAAGNIYVVSANGDIGGIPSDGTYDESVLKLAPERLTVSDVFTPFDKDDLDANDLDLGSSGALLLPDEAGSSAHPHLLFTSGKEGRMYLLDRDRLGGNQTGSDTGALDSQPVSSSPTFGMAAYFKNSIYLAPENSPMFAFSVSRAAFSSSPSARTANSFSALGATPSISANGDRNGVLWAVSSEAGGKLLAYDAANLKQLYDSDAQPADTFDGYTEFSVPSIADGKVFVPDYNGVAVYGELASDPPVISGVTNAASYSTDAISPGSLISLFGSGLASVTLAAPSVPLPMSLADVSVIINGVTAPVLFASPHQINAQVPSGLAAGPAGVVVRVEGTLSSPANITLVGAAPGVFTDGQGQAAALNADGSVNSPQNPARAGSFVSVFFTGQGPVATQIDDGAAPPAGIAISATSPVSASIGTWPAAVQFAGLAPNYPGLAQINLQVPQIPSGVYPVVIKIGGSASNAAQLAVSGP